MDDLSIYEVNTRINNSFRRLCAGWAMVATRIFDCSTASKFPVFEELEDNIWMSCIFKRRVDSCVYIR